MKLYILRHGDAVAHGDARYGESERPLTPKGVQRTKHLAHALREMEIVFDVILSSPLTRARQTAEMVVHGLRLQTKIELTEHLSIPGSMLELVNRISAVRPVPENVLLVGHEPYLSGFISLLCTGGTGLSLAMKKGGLCRLEVETLRCARCATLEWLLPPRLVELRPPSRKSAD